MRAPLLSVAALVVASAAGAFAAPPVSVYIAPRTALVPASGRVTFDVYWFNRSERAATIPSMESYSLAISVVSRNRTRLPRFLGSALSSLHGNPSRSIAPRTIIRDEITHEIDIFPDELAEVTAEFGGSRGRAFKSNTVVLAKTRWPKHTSKKPNQAMQLTASKSAIYAFRVCHRASMLRSMHRGLAAADLVSR